MTSPKKTLPAYRKPGIRYREECKGQFHAQIDLKKSDRPDLICMNCARFGWFDKNPKNNKKKIIVFYQELYGGWKLAQAQCGDKNGEDDHLFVPNTFGYYVPKDVIERYYKYHNSYYSVFNSLKNLIGFGKKPPNYSDKYTVN